MTKINTLGKYKIYFASLFWGLGQMFLGYRLRGLALLAIGIAVNSILLLFSFVGFLNINYIPIIMLFVLIFYILVFFDLWKLIKKTDIKYSNIYNNNISSLSPIQNDNKIIICNLCNNKNPDNYSYCSQCGNKIKW